jgi:ANTAR domain/GAF domain
VLSQGDLDAVPQGQVPSVSCPIRTPLCAPAAPAPPQKVLMGHPSPDVAASLEEAARTIGRVDSLDDTLSAIAYGARWSVPGIDHAGISTIDRRGVPTTRAATDEVVMRLDNLQYSMNEGPCVDAMRAQVVVSVPRIAHEQRWPTYVPAAVREVGLKAQLAVRLYLDEDTSMGGLNLYSTQREDIDPDAESIARLFAAHAAVALGKTRVISELNDALESRTVIGKAIGILMERHQMNEDRAFAFLSRASSHGNIKLRDVAQEMVDAANGLLDGAPQQPLTDAPSDPGQPEPLPEARSATELAVALPPPDGVVHQASGILMVRRGTSIDEAIAHLHELAVAQRRSVKDVAADVVESIASSAP